MKNVIQSNFGVRGLITGLLAVTVILGVYWFASSSLSSQADPVFPVTKTV